MRWGAYAMAFALALAPAGVAAQVLPAAGDPPVVTRRPLRSEGDETLRVVKTALPDLLRHELRVKDGDDYRTIWSYDVPVPNGGPPQGGLALWAYDIKDGQLFAVGAVDRFRVVLLRADDLKSKAKAIIALDPGWFALADARYSIAVEAPDRVIFFSSPPSKTILFRFDRGNIFAENGNLVDPRIVYHSDFPEAPVRVLGGPADTLPPDEALKTGTAPVVAPPGKRDAGFLGTGAATGSNAAMRKAPGVSVPPTSVATEASPSFRSWAIVSAVIAGVFLTVLARLLRRSG